jgi:predicted ester cyclase
MSENTGRNKALMSRVYREMWNKHQPGLASELFAQPEGVELFVSSFLLAFPDLQHTVEGMVEEGDVVAVQFSASGTHSGPWLGHTATGRKVGYTGVTWARIQGRRIVEHHTWWDKAGLLEQVTQQQ